MDLKSYIFVRESHRNCKTKATLDLWVLIQSSITMDMC